MAQHVQGMSPQVPGHESVEASTRWITRTRCRSRYSVVQVKLT